MAFDPDAYLNSTASSGFDPDAYLNKKKPKSMTNAEVATSALINAPASFGRQVSGAIEAITSPVQTAKSILDIGAGELQKVLPKQAVDFINRFEWDKQAPERQQQMATAINKMYSERYGTEEGLKKTIAEDPFAVLGDISTALGLGGGVLKTAGMATKAPSLVQAGEMATAGATRANPLLPAQKLAGAATRGVGKTAAVIQGGFTGTGAAPIEEAYAAGRYSKPEFWQNLTQEGDVTDVVSTAKAGVLNLKQAKNAQYRTGMADISKDKSILSFDDIDNAVDSAIKNTKFKNVVKQQAANAKVAQVKREINNWKKLDPAEYHTPEGIDALKQRIGDIMESVPYEESSVRNALGGIYSATKKTISNQAPTYGKIMKDYEVASDMIREIERGLSLGKKSSADAALRKLQSVMRNNVQSNYGERINMVKELEKAGGKDIMPALAGQALNPWLARGMVGQIERAGGLAGMFMNPLATIIGGTVASPKVTGATAFSLGKLASLQDKIAKSIPLTAEEARQAALLGLQANQAQGLLGGQ